jgi:tetratricopeptide (TPR) repeat protein
MLYETIEDAAPAASDVRNGIPIEAIRSALDRIVTSRTFVHSHRICLFLRFVVDECLAGQQHRLKEYPIGLEVFQRHQDFDPRVDSIVRVEARRLRSKLDEYYVGDGRDEEVRILLRKGSYVPSFEYRRNGSLGFAQSSLHAQRRSLALAPFTVDGGGSSGGPEPETLIAEITRRLTHVLIKEGCFQVVPWMAGDNGNTSKPDYIVESSLRLQGENLQLLVQLLNVIDGSHVWSEAAECTIQDLLPVEDLARDLNRELLAPSGDGVRAKLGGEHEQAYVHYLRGRFEWKLGAVENIRDSVKLFEQAVGVDPSYGAAWAALAEALVVSSLFGILDPEERVGIKLAAQRACDLNPDLPEAHIALGAALSLVDLDWAAGERELQRAIQIGPCNSMAYVAYGFQLACRGLCPAALVELERAVELDPASLCSNFVRGWVLGVCGRLDEAIAQHGLVVKLAPDFALAHLGLGWALASKHMFAEAIPYLQKAPLLSQGCLGYCLVMAGQREEAFQELAKVNGHSSVTCASIYSGLGDRERALAHLEMAASSGDPSLAPRLWSPEFETLRGEPRFRALQEQMGLRG